ncbi:hypothetical protein OF83DRAFT_1085443 [Amylostereum chailletii]|nr:hypothetical protein OF83DRAFT_1085443 [Amylostereum chailletii]
MQAGESALSLALALALAFTVALAYRPRPLPSFTTHPPLPAIKHARASMPSIAARDLMAFLPPCAMTFSRARLMKMGSEKCHSMCMYASTAPTCTHATHTPAARARTPACITPTHPHTRTLHPTPTPAMHVLRASASPQPAPTTHTHPHARASATHPPAMCTPVHNAPVYNAPACNAPTWAPQIHAQHPCAHAPMPDRQRSTHPPAMGMHARNPPARNACTPRAQCACPRHHPRCMGTRTPLAPHVPHIPRPLAPATCKLGRPQRPRQQRTHTLAMHGPLPLGRRNERTLHTVLNTHAHTQTAPMPSLPPQHASPPALGRSKYALGTRWKGEGLWWGRSKEGGIKVGCIARVFAGRQEEESVAGYKGEEEENKIKLRTVQKSADAEKAFEESTDMSERSYRMMREETT